MHAFIYEDLTYNLYIFLERCVYDCESEGRGGLATKGADQCRPLEDLRWT